MTTKVLQERRLEQKHHFTKQQTNVTKMLYHFKAFEQAVQCRVRWKIIHIKVVNINKNNMRQLKSTYHRLLALEKVLSTLKQIKDAAIRNKAD